MNSKEIRSKYLEFFALKGHEVVPSAPMVVKNDPTLMFTNAGMNQFKDIFLGNAEVKSKRIANSQKCLRVSGKHNDLEEVGVDTYHHTMFEMLGNWSFGDYFKKDAIAWAWELLTEVYKIDKDRLYVTVFGGDDKDGLEADTEAVDYWKELISEDRILYCSKKDNFWEMGESGPCGPCSEIHVDLRSPEEVRLLPGRDLVNNDHPQVIEIWNLVFMEFNRNAQGLLSPLPSKHIDTGMGFERLAVVLQAKKSNYDTDVFSPLIEVIVETSGKSYTGSDTKSDIAIRVVADHVRAVAFAIADGQLPANSGAGYVIRRILRRAIRYSYSFLDVRNPFIYKLAEVLDEQMGDYFPEIRTQRGLIEKVIHEEEENFLRTLEKGIHRLNEVIAQMEGLEIPGRIVFELYDTFGFPSDLTALIAGERGKSVDELGFQKELNIQKERSRAAGKMETGDWVVLHEDDEEEFIGYDRISSDVRITRYRYVQQKGKSMVQLVFNHTPFYPEGGGQVGDTGRLENSQEKLEIIDTKKENNLIIHYAEKMPEYPSKEFKAMVDGDRRYHSAQNHSATHLLHQILREVLGTHVEQKGSLVNPAHLRFDFSHFAKVSAEELALIERRVNEMIWANHPLMEHRRITLGEAKEKGAMMLFGEKYGDIVRMIQFGESKELCGGIHVSATGELGLFRIIHEGAVAAGVRRIEAITGKRAYNTMVEAIDELTSTKQVLKTGKNTVEAVEDLLEKKQALEKELERLRHELAGDIKKKLLDKIQSRDGLNVLIEEVKLGPAEIKNLAFELKQEVDNLFAVLGSSQGDKALLTCFVSDHLVKERGLNANTVIRGLAKDINGGGGGQPFFATAGGSKIEGIQMALKNAENFIS